MKKKTVSLLCTAILVAGALVVVGNAQNRERFGISAKAGGVNAVSGQVMVKRAGQDPQLLTSQDDLASGDVVTTGYGSQAEILLNPGTYLRLAEKSEFEMVDTSLDKLRVKLNKGSAIIEATGTDQTQLQIPIITDQKRMTIVRAGIYRINVRPGVTELFVRKGRMSIGATKDDIVKSGKKVTFSSTGQSIAKLTDADKDDFDSWSKMRGQTLAKANLRLSTRALNGYLSSSGGFGSFGGFGFGRYGLWTWSPFASCYTFLPFNYGWGSPYGSFYGFSAYPSYGGGMRGGYNNPTIVRTGPTSGGSSSGSSGGPVWTTGGSGSGSSGGSAGPSGGGMSSPSGSHPGSQAGPRDPDSGSRSINRIKDPIN